MRKCDECGKKVDLGESPLGAVWGGYDGDICGPCYERVQEDKRTIRLFKLGPEGRLRQKEEFERAKIILFGEILS